MAADLEFRKEPKIFKISEFLNLETFIKFRRRRHEFRRTLTEITGVREPRFRFETRDPKGVTAREQ